MIRPATISDIPMILEMGRAFASEAGVIDHVGWDDDTVIHLLEQLIALDEGILIVGDNGMIGGIVSPHPYSGQIIFQELFWRSHGFEGIRLLKAAEQAAKERGAKLSVMIGMDTLPDLERLYGRMNYKPMERLYCKDL